MPKPEFITEGYYIAICNTTNFDGFYVRVFYYPGQDAVARRIGVDQAPSGGMYNASWYFLNICDFTACVETVYPLELFMPRIFCDRVKEYIGQTKTWGFARDFGDVVRGYVADK